MKTVLVLTGSTVMVARLFIALVLCIPPQPASSEEFPYGQFRGVVRAEWIKDDGRNMRLLEDFVYESPLGEIWVAPKGSVVNGASIPRFAWSIIGGPFEGEYREASVLHDVGCDEMRRPWQSVHTMFYHAMLANKVSRLKAKVMFAAVYHFGPRWPRLDTQIITSETQGEVMAEAERRLLPGEEIADLDLVERDVPCGDDEIACAGPSSQALAVFEYKPEPSAISLDQFERLASAIEKEDLSLDEIMRYRQRDEAN